MKVESWLALTLALSSVACLGAALAIRLSWRLLARFMEKLTPRRQSSAMLALLATPLLCALAMPLLAFFPSLLDLFGVLSDHCGHHVHHAFHLCFLHSAPPPLHWGVVVLAMAPVILIARGIFGEARMIMRTRALAADFHALSTASEDADVRLLSTEQPQAMVMGWPVGRIFVSRGMGALLDESSLVVVKEHERTHIAHRDVLRKSLARVLGSLMFPETRAKILDILDIARERICDERAAEIVGDRLLVAETLLRIERAHGTTVPCGALGVSAKGFEVRVRALLEDTPREQRAHTWAGWLAALLSIAAFTAAEHMHHGLETLVLSLIGG